MHSANECGTTGNMKRTYTTKSPPKPDINVHNVNSKYLFLIYEKYMQTFMHSDLIDQNVVDTIVIYLNR